MTSLKNASDNVSSLVIPQNDGKLISLNELGQISWNSEIQGELQTELVVNKQNVYLVTRNPEINNLFKIQGISLETGLNVWNKEIKAETPIENIKLLKYKEGLLLLSNDQTFYLIDTDKNELRKTGKIESKVSSNINITDNSLIFANSLNQVVEYSILEDKAKILFQSSKPVNKIFLDKNGYLLIGDVFGQITQFDKNLLKKKWTFRGGAEFSSLTETEGFYILNSLDNYIYCLSVKKGKLIWKKRLEARSEEIFAKDKGQIISSLINGQSTVFLEVEKGRTSNQINTPEDSFFVTQPLEFGNLIILTTNKNLTAYSFDACPK